jgi:hypothetical protein
MARITWTFDGVSFRVKGSDEYDPWFGHEYTHTYDEVLGGTQSYLDLGSHTRTPLEFRAQFASEATRDAMVLKLGITGTLTNDSPAGYSGTATLLKARRVDGPSGQAFHLDCMFRFRP